MYETYDLCVAELYGNIDEKYKAFNDPIAKSEYKTLGVRIPVIKKLAKSVPLNRRAEILTDFFAEKEHTFESVLFAGCLAARKGDYEQTREYLMRLIPLFGSWAHVDCVVPCLDWADSDALWKDFRYLTDRSGQYEKRMYIIIMMGRCLSDRYIGPILDTLARDVEYGQYYVDMAAAWLLAECLIKFYGKTLPLFTSQTFPKFVHNKAIQKARESYRITPDVKEYLKTLKIS